MDPRLPPKPSKAFKGGVMADTITRGPGPLIVSRPVMDPSLAFSHIATLPLTLTQRWLFTKCLGLVAEDFSEDFSCNAHE